MNGGRAIVLVVDDDLAVRESLKFALEAEGLLVHVCSSGHDLLRHPALRQARCLILDYRMPTMDGLSVMDHMAARDISVPVILITVNATEGLRHRAAAAGARYVLEKPLQDGALMDSIHTILA